MREVKYEYGKDKEEEAPTKKMKIGLPEGVGETPPLENSVEMEAASYSDHNIMDEEPTYMEEEMKAATPLQFPKTLEGFSYKFNEG